MHTIYIHYYCLPIDNIKQIQFVWFQMFLDKTLDTW